MKTRIITIIAALLSLTAGYAADNLQIEEITLKPGEEKELKLSLMQDKEKYAGVQFDIQLPTGFTLGMSNNEVYYAFAETQPDDLACQVVSTGENAYRFMIYSNSLKLLKSGELFILRLKAEKEVALREYSLQLNDVMLSDIDGAVTKVGSNTSIVKVSDVFNLIYVVDGEQYKTVQYEYGASITPEAYPTKEGYTFSGWSDLPETMPANDVTVTGSYTKVDNIDYNLYVTCYGNSMSKVQSGSLVRVTVGVEMANSGSENIVVTKLVAKDPDTNNILYTTTDASILGELNGGTDKFISLQINQNFDNYPVYELEYTLNSKKCSYAASDYRILSVTANKYGYLTFSGLSVGSDTKKFSLKPGEDAVIGIVPKEGAVFSKLTVSNSDVTSSVSNNQYVISNITANTSVIAMFDMNSGDIQTIDGHEYIDLGLSSGKYWSPVNYGADNPEESGSYLSSATSSISKQWGEHWTAPTKEEMQELIDECEWTWTELNGTNGFKITGPSGNSIFLPAAGKKDSMNDIFGTVDSSVGSIAYYFTSSTSSSIYSWILSASSSEYKLIQTYITTESYPLRPITTIKKDNPIKGDANGDGKVDAADIADIVNYMMGKPTSTGKFTEQAADVNNDGAVNAADIVKIVSIIMGK